MGTHPIFESDFDCLTESLSVELVYQNKALLASLKTGLGAKNYSAYT